MKNLLYRLVTSPEGKAKIKHLERIMERLMPWFYTHVYLRIKAKLKGYIIKAMTHAAETHEGEGYTFPFHPEKNGSARTGKPPLVTIIVPNYNHAPYLKKRLESIYGQTYTNYEVLLLDDCSTDGSRDILSYYAKQHKENTRIYFNEKNSGGVFKQWEKGMLLAKGTLIWIAESDDFCDSDFLECMIPSFEDGSVMLSFARTDFVENGTKVYDTETYLSDLPLFDWKHSFTVTAADLVAHAFAVKNIIPNVSAVVFRKKPDFSEELKNLWRDMKLCGDWAFYLDCIKGGCAHYCCETTDYYRVQPQSTSLKIQKEPRYYQEHERIATFIEANYEVGEEPLLMHQQQLQEHYLSYYGGEDKHDIDAWFDVEKIRRAGNCRKPNVLFGIFSMTIGGGETFPLYLANEMKRQGIPVTVIDFEMDAYRPGVRQILRNDVPFLRLKETAGLMFIYRSMHIDIVHTHHGCTDEAVSYTIRDKTSRPKQIITLHGMYEATDEQYLVPLLDKVTKKASVFVYIADKNLKPFVEHNLMGKVHLVKIGNGLPYAPGTPIPRAKLGICEDAFVLCIVSRAIPEKGWEAAVEAVKLAREKSGREIELLLVGSGEMYDRMNGHVPPYVHMVGFQPNVRDYFATADCGLLPSEFSGESFPLTIIDSLFAGRPVIATDLGEVRNQLRTGWAADGTDEYAGIVLSLKKGKVDRQELAVAITRCVMDSTYFDRLCARVGVATEKFRIDTVANQYLVVYHQVLEDAGEKEWADLQGQCNKIGNDM